MPTSPLASSTGKAIVWSPLAAELERLGWPAADLGHLGLATARGVVGPGRAAWEAWVHFADLGHLRHVAHMLHFGGPAYLMPTAAEDPPVRPSTPRPSWAPAPSGRPR